MDDISKQIDVIVREVVRRLKPDNSKPMVSHSNYISDLVVYDDLGVGIDDKIFLSEGAEAAQPFYPDIKPIDAYNAGIIDKLEIVE